MLRHSIFLTFLILIVKCSQGQQQNHSQSSLHSNVAPTPQVEVLSRYDNNLPDGSFNHSYETSNGIKVTSQGYIKKIIIPRFEDVNGKVVDEHEQEVLVQSGSYSYVEPDGNVITLTYIADENGFQPSGAHLPVAENPLANQYQHQEQFNQERKIQDFRGQNQQQQVLNQDRPIQDYRNQNQLGQEISNRPPFQQQGGFTQDRPIQTGFAQNQQYDGGARRTRQSYQSYEPGYGVVENRPINDYRPQSYNYNYNPYRRYRQSSYDERPIQQGYYPGQGGGLSSSIYTSPSYQYQNRPIRTGY